MSQDKSSPDIQWSLVPKWTLVLCLFALSIWFVYSSWNEWQNNFYGTTIEKGPIVTLDNFKNIKDGMTYRQVVSIIGSEGEEAGRNKVSGIPLIQSIETVIYIWRNHNGSSMSAIFQNDKLNSKTQTQLP